VFHWPLSELLELDLDELEAWRGEAVARQQTLGVDF